MSEKIRAHVDAIIAEIAVNPLRRIAIDPADAEAGEIVRRIERRLKWANPPSMGNQNTASTVEAYRYVKRCHPERLQAWLERHPGFKQSDKA